MTLLTVFFEVPNKINYGYIYYGIETTMEVRVSFGGDKGPGGLIIIIHPKKYLPPIIAFAPPPPEHTPN